MQTRNIEIKSRPGHRSIITREEFGSDIPNCEGRIISYINVDGLGTNGKITISAENRKTYQSFKYRAFIKDKDELAKFVLLAAKKVNLEYLFN